MTGFARRERQGPWGTLVCELRTVNHRYLEASLRLPDELKALDNEARQAIAAALRRGKVDASLYLKSASGTQRSLELDNTLLDELLARVDQVRAQLADCRARQPAGIAALARCRARSRAGCEAGAGRCARVAARGSGRAERHSPSRRAEDPRAAAHALRFDAHERASGEGAAAGSLAALARAHRRAHFAARRRTRSRAAGAGAGAVRAQDGRRRGAGPARRLTSTKSPRCSIRPSPPGAGSTS